MLGLACNMYRVVILIFLVASWCKVTHLHNNVFAHGTVTN